MSTPQVSSGVPPHDTRRVDCRSHAHGTQQRDRGRVLRKGWWVSGESSDTRFPIVAKYSFFFSFSSCEGEGRKEDFISYCSLPVLHSPPTYIVIYKRCVGVFQRNRGFSIYISPRYRYRITIKRYTTFIFLIYRISALSPRTFSR